MIHFFTEEITFKLNGAPPRAAWIENVIKAENYSPGEVNYIFCSDEYLWEINTQYLGHDTYTDIITFDQSETENTISGDIYISIERVAENAATRKIPFEDELDRLLVHGVLHLCGYSDHSEEEKKIMRKKEDACLSLR